MKHLIEYYWIEIQLWTVLYWSRLIEYITCFSTMQKEVAEISGEISDEAAIDCQGQVHALSLSPAECIDFFGRKNVVLAAEILFSDRFNWLRSC
jgi:hypothetical protein